MPLSRRHFLSSGAATLGAASLVPSFAVPMPWQKAAAADAEPHYMLEVFFPGGMDCLYTFDARPLALTTAGLQVNYLREEPTVLTGKNGNTAWMTSLVKPLLPHFDSFSVLNGVIMSRGFDGHDNNVNYFETGSPFGGESFLPHLNETRTPTPIDYVAAADSDFAATTNSGNSVPLSPASAGNLATRLAAQTALGGGATSAFLQQRFALNSEGDGRFSAGAAAMQRAFTQAPALAASLRRVTPPVPGEDPMLGVVRLAGDLFRNQLCRSAQIVFGPTLLPGVNLDTHDAGSAAKAPAAIGTCMSALATFFKYLRDTPYDAKRSLLDVTTIVVGTEFGRTMRQSFVKDLSLSGTDHNPLKNTVLLGGKGIKPGLVVGATDLQTAQEAASGAHLSLDAESIKAMGRPLDFASLHPLAASPTSYDPAAYLDFACVANTLYSAFGADRKHYRSLSAGSDPAQVVTALLA